MLSKGTTRRKLSVPASPEARALRASRKFWDIERRQRSLDADIERLNTIVAAMDNDTLSLYVAQTTKLEDKVK